MINQISVEHINFLNFPVSYHYICSTLQSGERDWITWLSVGANLAALITIIFSLKSIRDLNKLTRTKEEKRNIENIFDLLQSDFDAVVLNKPMNGIYEFFNGKAAFYRAKRFHSLIEDILLTDEDFSCLNHYLSHLMNGALLINCSKNISEDDWKYFVKKMRLETDFARYVKALLLSHNRPSVQPLVIA